MAFAWPVPDQHCCPPDTFLKKSSQLKYSPSLSLIGLIVLWFPPHIFKYNWKVRFIVLASQRIMQISRSIWAHFPFHCVVLLEANCLKDFRLNLAFLVYWDTTFIGTENTVPLASNSQRCHFRLCPSISLFSAPWRTRLKINVIQTGVCNFPGWF